MADTLLEFLFQAYRDGRECTLNELRSYDEFSGLSLMQSIFAIDERLRKEGLCIQPPIDEGDTGDLRVVAKAETDEGFNLALSVALKENESHNTEFKESLYLKKKVFGNKDIDKKYWVGEEIVFEVVATICSFLNSDGGTLVIGAKDGGELVGI